MSSELAPPSLTGRWVELVPLNRQHLADVYAIISSPEVAFRWRFRGAVPPPDVFEQTLWQNVLCQFAILRRGTVAGSAVAYNPDLTQGYVYAGMAAHPRYIDSGVTVEAMYLMMRYMFATWPLRKIYMEASEFTYRSFIGGADRFFSVEGCFREHDFYGGRYWDKYTLAVYPKHIAAAGEQLFPDPR